jgi:hypothetical protein
MRPISYISPFYLNGDMLKAQLRTWARYPEDVLARFTFILIDDCSPKPAEPIIRSGAATEAVRARIQLYRITTDIPWNQHGARNLGAHLAADGWLVMTDIDHQLLADDARELTVMALDPACFYYPRRIKTGLVIESDRRHCNSFVVTRRAFLASGGYDEDFCGSYGGDGQFVAILKTVARPVDLESVTLVRYPREVIADASTTTLDRTGPLKERYIRLAARKPKRPYKAVNPLRFKWERVL